MLPRRPHPGHRMLNFDDLASPGVPRSLVAGRSWVSKWTSGLGGRDTSVKSNGVWVLPGFNLDRLIERILSKEQPKKSCDTKTSGKHNKRNGYRSWCKPVWSMMVTGIFCSSETFWLWVWLYWFHLLAKSQLYPTLYSEKYSCQFLWETVGIAVFWLCSIRNHY